MSICFNFQRSGVIKNLIINKNYRIIILIIIIGSSNHYKSSYTDRKISLECLSKQKCLRRSKKIFFYILIKIKTIRLWAKNTICNQYILPLRSTQNLLTKEIIHYIFLNSIHSSLLSCFENEEFF